MTLTTIKMLAIVLVLCFPILPAPAIIAAAIVDSGGGHCNGSWSDGTN